MLGPEPKGFWTRSTGLSLESSHQSLIAGSRFRVIKEFQDFDGQAHPIGESWTFLGHCFLPYDDGMSFFVSIDGEQEWHIRLQWRPEEQAYILDDLQQFFAPAV